MMHRIKKVVKKKSVIAAMSVVAVTGTVYGIQSNKAPDPARYVLEPVSRGSVVATVEGSGQVEGEAQVDLKPKVSGEIVAVFISSGQEVTAGTPLFEIERTDAVKAVRDARLSVRDAELALASSEIQLAKTEASADSIELVKAEHTLNQAMRALDDLKAGPDPLDIRQAEASLENALRNAEMSDDGVTPKNVRETYDDAVPVLKSALQTLESSLADADEIIGMDNVHANDAYEYYLGLLKTSTLMNASIGYYAAVRDLEELDELVSSFSVTGSPTDEIDEALPQAIDALNSMEAFIFDVEDVLAFTPQSSALNQNGIDALKAAMASSRSGVSGKITTILNQQRAIEQAWTSFESAESSVENARLSLEKVKRGADANDIATAEERVAEAQAALDELRAGSDDIDIASARNAVEQRRSSLEAARNKLADAEEELDDYTVRAPFDGIVTGIEAHLADEASPSAALVTLVTKSKVAKITLNEVDIAKVEVGQKATLTFDAAPDATIAGVVAETDAVGTAEQGVVGFGVTIAFLTDDERILPGMSVNAAIIIDSRTDALVVPNAALTSYGSGSAVQTLPGVTAEDAANPAGVTSETEPESVPVETGLADDQYTEILSGVSEGDLIVTRAIQSDAGSTAATAGGATGMPGVGGFGGGNVRFMTR
jgi:HlyD family secretion protein